VNGTAVAAAVRAAAANPVTASDVATAVTSFGLADVRLGFKDAAQLLNAAAVLLQQRAAELTVRDAANAAWGFAAAHSSAAPTSVMETLAGVVLASHTSSKSSCSSSSSIRMASSDVAHCAWAFATCGISTPGLYKFLASQALHSVSDMPPADVANTAWGIAKGWTPENSVIAATASASADVTAASTATDTAATAGATAGESADDASETVQTVADVAAAEQAAAAETAARKAAAAAKAAAAVTAHKETVALKQQLALALLNRAQQSLSTYKPRHLTQLAWALGTWQHRDGLTVPSTAAAVAVHAILQATADAATTAATADTATAAAGAADYDANDNSSSDAESAFAGYEADLLWSLAALGGAPDTLSGQQYTQLSSALGLLAERITAQQQQLTPQALCSVLWSVAVLQLPARSLLRSSASKLLDTVHELPLSAVAQLVWSHAKLGVQAPKLLERAVSVVELKLKDMDVHDMARSVI
jgi:trimeric autotransporter adhesin